MYSNQKLYKNIHAMINYRKMKIGEVESAAGVSQGYLIRSQKANAAPTIATIAKLSEILDCPMDILVTADIEKYTSEFFCLNEFISKLIDKTQLGEIAWSSDEKAVYHAHLSDVEDIYLAGAPIAGAWKKFSIWFQAPSAAAPETTGTESSEAATESEKIIAYSEDTNKDQYTFLHIRELIRLVKNVIECPIDQKALLIIKTFLAEKAETPSEAPSAPSESDSAPDDRPAAE